MPPKVESLASFMDSPRNQERWPDEVERRRAAFAIRTAAIQQAEAPSKGFTIKLDAPEGDSPSWVHILPYGEYTHAVFGDINITPQKVANFVDNFKKGTRGTMLDVDYAHKSDPAKGNKAAGWFVNLEQRDDGLWGLVSWTGEARQEIKDGAWKYMSAEYQDEWCDAKDNCHNDVLFGAAITNRPFMKELATINMEEFVELQQYTKTAANYGPGQDTQISCGLCEYFDASGDTCSLVEGPIDASFTCDYFSPDESSPTAGMGDLKDDKYTGMTTISTDPVKSNTDPRFSEASYFYYSTDTSNIQLRDFNAAARKKAASSGAAMPDGSFPIYNREDLINALGLMDVIKNSKAMAEEVEMEEFLKKLQEALKLADDTSEEDILKHIAGLPSKPEEPAPPSTTFAEQYPEEAKRLVELELTNRELAVDKKLQEWMQPHPETKLGIAPALSETLKGYRIQLTEPSKFDEVIEAIRKHGLVDYSVKGSSRLGEPELDKDSDKFLAEVKKFQEENEKASYADAVRATTQAHPDLARAYQEDRHQLSGAADV